MNSNKNVKGNVIIFFFLQIANICLAVLGFFLLGISVYLMILSKKLNYFNLLFFIFSIFFILLSYYGCQLRVAPVWNLIYSTVLSVVFFFYMVLTVILFIDGESIVNTILESYETSDETRNEIHKLISKNIRIVNDLLLIIVLLFVKYFY
jgi:hypothetical protein